MTRLLMNSSASHLPQQLKMLALRRLFSIKYFNLFLSVAVFSTKLYLSIFDQVLVLFCFGFVLFNKWVERMGTEKLKCFLITVFIMKECQ